MFCGITELNAIPKPRPSKVVNKNVKVYPIVNPLIKSRAKIIGLPKNVKLNMIIGTIKIIFFLTTSNNKVP